MSKYQIIGGGTDRPLTLTAQAVEKKSGMTRLEGPEHKYAAPKGAVIIPNSTQAWGRRVIKDGKVSTDLIDLKDPKYRGEIEFMKWGAGGGYLINLRYLKGFNTLDAQYQEVVLGFRPNENDQSASDVYFINLENGLNEFDENIDHQLVEMLRVHRYNKDSESKDPNVSTWLFQEFKEVEVEEKKKVSLNQKFEAGTLVKEAAEDNTGGKLQRLRAVMGKLIVGDEGEDFDVLLTLADENPEQFFVQINLHKVEVSNLFERFKSYKALDYSIEGELYATKPDRVKVAAGLSGKGEKVLDWILENYLEQSAADAVNSLTNISKNLK